MIASSHEGGRESRMCRTRGRSTRGIKAFGRVSVRGRSLLPKPPAMITSCIRSPMRGRGYVFSGLAVSLRDDRDDVVSPEDHGPDAAHIVFLRLFRILEDHVHVVVISDELPFEDPVILEEQLDALVDGFF